MEIILAIVLGTFFGFALHRVGASNPHNILNMLRLTDLHLMKAILYAVGLSSLLLFFGLATGIIDTGNLSVKSSYVGVVIGGVLLGLGFGSVGYCPGTGWVALADGRKDAIFFILGGLVGALVFIFAYGPLKETFLFNEIAGGKVTLAQTGNEDFRALIGQVPGMVVAGVIAVVFMAIAWILPSRKA
jgi:hypothetical protein